MWVIASLHPNVGSQTIPLYKSAIFAEYSTNTVELEILTQFKTLTTSKSKIQATQQIKGYSGSFKTI